MDDRTLRLAVPNKGRLREPALRLLREAGLVFEQTERALSVTVRNADIELLFVRAEDVVELVSDRSAHLGITGRDLLMEESIRLKRNVVESLSLGFGRCDLTVAVPAESALEKPEDFEGLRIATSHPNLTRRFFSRQGVLVKGRVLIKGVEVEGVEVEGVEEVEIEVEKVKVVPMKGSVEVATKLGVADAIADLVSTGSTLKVNGLRPVFTILESEAVLVDTTSTDEVIPDHYRILTALESVIAGRRRRYLLLNAPMEALDTITGLIPGLEAPTVIPLAEDGMAAVHSVVDRDEVWNLLPSLKEAGGQGILVLPIGQLVP